MKSINVSNSLAESIENLLKEIMEYESDTFSAQGSGLTEAEAQEIAAILVYGRLSVGINIDGYDISVLLDSIRDEDS